MPNYIEYLKLSVTKNKERNEGKITVFQNKNRESVREI